MQFAALRAELQHVAENCNAAALLPDRRLRQQRDRRPHGRRIGVIAFVDQQSGPSRNRQRAARAAAARRLEIAQRKRGEREVSSGERRRRQDGKRVECNVAARHPDLVGHRLPQDAGFYGR